MAETGTILRFPSGVISDPGRSRPGTVAAIADALYLDLAGACALIRPPVSLQVRLDALCGVDDETIARLAAVAAAGALTPESAARLALRHAKEISAVRRTRSCRIRGAPGRYDLRLCGNGLRSFAMRIGSTDDSIWIGSATLGSFGRLLEACPEDGRAICLLVGCAEAVGPTVRLVTTPSWQATLLGRSMRPGWRTLRHLLVVGGFPSGHRERSDVADAVAHRLRSQPHLVVMTKQAHALGPGAHRNPVADQILQLLAVALPGLFATGGAAG